VNDVTQKPWPVRVAFFRGHDGELVELLEERPVTLKLSDANADLICQVVKR